MKEVQNLNDNKHQNLNNLFYDRTASFKASLCLIFRGNVSCKVAVRDQREGKALSYPLSWL